MPVTTAKDPRVSKETISTGMGVLKVTALGIVIINGIHKGAIALNQAAEPSALKAVMPSEPKPQPKRYGAFH